jgi:hypothetical protein
VRRVWLHGDGPEQIEGPLLSAVGRGVDLEGGYLGFRSAGAAALDFGQDFVDHNVFSQGPPRDWHRDA